MSFDARKNFAYSTVAVAPTPSSTGGSLGVQAATGALFPAAPFNAIVWPANTNPTAVNAEIVRVTNVSTDTFTITRHQEGSSAINIGVGYQIMDAVTDKTLSDIEATFSSYVPTSRTINGHPLSANIDLTTEILQAVYPVGSIYINASVSSNPATLLGFGTWVAFAGGRTLIGVGTSDQTFSAGATGGESNHTLTTNEMPSHTHTNGIVSGGTLGIKSAPDLGITLTDTGATGGGASHNNLPPYIVVYMWKRTA